jgi:hypothetical protein
MSASGHGSNDATGERILQNEELVRQILESAEELSEPMTLDAFLEWLRGVGNESSP